MTAMFFLRSFLIDKLWRPDEQVDKALTIGKLRRKNKKDAAEVPVPKVRARDRP